MVIIYLIPVNRSTSWHMNFVFMVDAFFATSLELVRLNMNESKIKYSVLRSILLYMSNVENILFLNGILTA